MAYLPKAIMQLICLPLYQLEPLSATPPLHGQGVAGEVLELGEGHHTRGQGFKASPFGDKTEGVALHKGQDRDGD